MATARSIQISVVHVALGVALGSVVEAVMPLQSASSSVVTQAFEGLVQVGLNGVLIASAAPLLTSDDPTHGIPFSMALFSAQPNLNKRIAFLSEIAKQQVLQVAQRMMPPAAEEESPTRSK